MKVNCCWVEERGELSEQLSMMIAEDTQRHSGGDCCQACWLGTEKDDFWGALEEEMYVQWGKGERHAVKRLQSICGN
jgi:hypothetical protein